jgi:dTDP-D-glucose 4,6-dehydratase
MKRAIITGIGGFVGSHFLHYLIKNTDWEIIGIDSFRHKGTVRRVVENLDESRVKIFVHDLSVPIDRPLENLLLQRSFVNGQVVEKPIDYIFNLASESAVERSANDPVPCLRNNYELMINMLEFARRIKPKLFLQFSTDEVYGEAETEPHKEWASILPSNPYCLLPGTKIITKKGPINIEDFNPLVDTCLSRQKGHIVEAKATKKFQLNYKGEIYNINAGGSNVSCTANHKFFKFETFFTEHKNTIGCSKRPHVRIAECCARDLKINDKILITRKIPCCDNRLLNPYNQNESLFRFLGYFVGDGCINKLHYVRLADEKIEYLYFYQELLRSLLGVSKKSSTHAFGNIYKHSTKQCYYLQFRSQNLEQLINLYVPKNDITSYVVGNEVENIKSFLAGFFDAESHYRIKNNKLVSVTMYQKEFKTLETIQFLLRNLGIVGMIEERHKHNKQTNKTYHGWRLKITDAASLKIVCEEIPSLKIKAPTRKPQRKNDKKVDHRRYRITSINKTLYEGPVYDLECPANHNYIANYFVVHNSASKAAQEALTISYWRTYNMPIVITNCMNLIGERQDPEKFLPKIIEKVIKGEEMPIYGDSEYSIGSRIYLHAYNAADAVVFISEQRPTLYSDFVEAGMPASARPDRYNICGNDELNNLELAQKVAAILKRELKYKIVPSEQARAGYDRRYALDGSKLATLGWEAPITLQESLELIIAWTLANPHWVI